MSEREGRTEGLDEGIRAVLAGQDSIVLPAELTEEHPRGVVAKSLYVQIQSMSIIEKIKLALRGNKEARTLLLRDANRLVQRFVLQNPRITEEEVIALVKNRGTDGELLRLVAGSQEWMKNYQVRLGLVENPRTPLAIALPLLAMLQERDLRNLARSKNVPTAIATQARRYVLQREGRKV